MLLKDFASLFTRCKQFRFKRVVGPFHHILIPKLDLLEDRCLPATNLFALGSPAGETSWIKLFDSNNGQIISQFQPFSADFKGGVKVVLADLNSDNQPDVIAAAGAGGGPHIKIFDGMTGAILSSFYAYDPSFTGGINIAAGDIGNGLLGIVSAPDGLMGPNVRVFSPAGEMLKNFMAYGSDFLGGVKVALGYAENGNAAIFTAAGLGGGPHVKAFEARSLKVIHSFYAYDPQFLGGVYLAAADLNRDGVSEIITGPGSGGGPNVKVYQRAGQSLQASFFAGNSEPAQGTLVGTTETKEGPRLTALVKKDGQQKLRLFRYGNSGQVQEVGAGVDLAGAGLGSVSDQAQVHRFQGNNSSWNVLTRAYTNDSAAPSSGAGSDMYSAHPIRYNDGNPEIRISLTDDSGVYGDILDYTNKLDYSTGQRVGVGWLYSGTPAALRDGTNLRIVLSASEVLTFVDPAPDEDAFSMTLYLAAQGVTDHLEFDQTSYKYLLTRADGTKYYFNNFFGGTSTAAQGTLETVKNSAGNTIYLVTARDGSGRSSTLEKSVVQGGTTIKTRRSLTYLSGGTNDGFISQMVFDKKVDSGSWTTDRTATLEYYSGTGDSGGTDNELKRVTIKDGSANVLSYSYFRYWLSGQSNGYNQAVKYVLTGSAYDRMVQAGYTPATASNTDLATFANHYFEYDDQFRANKETAAGNGTFTNVFTTNPNGLSTTDFNYWNVKTVETLPDGNQNIVYTNFQKQVILSAFKNTTTNDKWISFKKYSSVGYVALTANPSAMTGYDDSLNDLVHYVGGNATYIGDSVGLVMTYSYGSSTTATSTTPGNGQDWLQSVSLSQGETGGAVPQQAMDYFKKTVNGIPLFFTADTTQYRHTNGTGGQTTSLSYTFQGSTAQPDQITQTNPIVTSSQNGSGSATTQTTVFDAYNRSIWFKDAAGFLTFMAYDGPTGAVTKQIVDVDSTQTTTFANLPSGWSSPTGGGLHLTTSYEVDSLGRATKKTYPNGRIDYMVYNDASFEVRVYPAWDSSSLAPLLPITVTREDKARGYTETLTMTATPSVSSGRPTGTESISGLQTLTRSVVNAVGQVTALDQYFNLSGVTYSASSVTLGTSGTNYYRTQYGYDTKGNRVRTLSPSGTIYRTVYDDMNRELSRWVGLDDTPTSGSWSPTNTTGTDLVKVSQKEFDGGGIGDGNITKVTQYPGGQAADLVSQVWYDWRNRPVATKAGVESSEATDVNRPINYLDYDNLNQVTKTRGYDGDAVSITSTGGVPNAPSGSLLRSQSENLFDELGRAYRTLTYSVDPSSGTVSSNSLATNVWYDAKGLVEKQSGPGGLVTKLLHDGPGRVTKTYTTDGGGDTAYGDADDVTGDNVLHQTENSYDSNSNVILVISKQHFHDDTGTGELGTVSTGNKARVSYQASYFDGADRLVNSVEVGTNGGSSFTRPSTVPSRSDTVLVTSYAYAASGLLQEITDPKGLISRTSYDNLGRVIQTVENYTNGTVTDTSNKTTAYTYNSVGRTSLTVELPSSGQQTTEWVFGVTTGGGSGLNSNDMIKEVRYPDPSTGASSSTEKDTITVNALGQKLTVTDRNASTHTYSYDVLGRQTADAVTTLGSGVDGSIRRMATGYDTQGNASLFTSYDAASGGNVVNQVKNEFNGLGQLTKEWQEHSGAVTGSSPNVQYTYSEMAGGANHSRLASITYASGYVLNYNYGSGLDSNISRLTSLSDSGNTLESYSYLGLATIIKRAHPQTGVDLTYGKLTGESVGDAGDQYNGLDRFGRVVDHRWINASNVDVDRFKYGYDRNSNRTYRENGVIASLSEVYTNDDLNQLASYKLGTLNGGKTDVTGTPTNAQTWNYDAVGNWDSVTTNSTTQTRGANRQNEITSVSGATTPTYDNNGNLTKDEDDNRFVYDAWNRLVQIKNSSNTVIATNAFDGLNRKAQVTTSSGTIDRIFSSDWQVLEEKSGSNTKNRYVWSPAYVDALVLRDRDTDSNGTLDERLYSLQDANWNTTGLVNTSGSVVERDTYSPFGVVTFRDASGASIGASAKDWLFLHQGGQTDSIGNYDFRNRVYSPTLGRWLTNDPLGFAAGDVNTYRTEINSPVNHVDPEGLILPLIGWGIAAYAIGEGGVWGYGLRLEHDPKMRSDELDEKLRQIHLANPKSRTTGRAPGTDNPNGSSVRNLGDELIPGNEAYRQSTIRDANRVSQIGERGYIFAVPPIGIRPGSNIRSPSGISAPNRINGRMPINGEYAGKTYFDALPKNLQRKYPNGVKFDGNGFPDFSPYSKKSVDIKYTGSRPGDYDAANKAAGFFDTPKGYTWHHHQDVGPNGIGRIELVPSALHGEIRHTGGVARWQELFPGQGSY